MKKYFVAVALLSSLNAGCTTELKVNRLDINHDYEKDKDIKTISGPIYYLPTGKVDIVVKRQLKKCEPDNIEFIVDADVTLSYPPDLSNPYLIRYEDLNGFLKKTTLNVELYKNGTIKKINGHLSDRTGEVVKNTVKGVAQIAKMVLGVPAVGLVPKAKPELQLTCNEITTDALSYFDSLSEEAKEKEKKLPSYGPGERLAKEIELTNIKTALAKYATYLTHKKRYSFIPAFEKSSEWKWDENLLTPPSLFIRWFDESQTEPLTALKEKIKILNAEAAQLISEASSKSDEGERKQKIEEAKNKRNESKEQTKIFYDVVNNNSLNPNLLKVVKELNSVASIDISGKLLSQSSKNLAETETSFIYRQPGSALLNVCKSSSCEEEINIIHRNSYLLPQAGIYTSLPLKNWPFESNILTAEFGPAGNLESFSYITEAQAESASATYAEVVGAAGDIVDAERKSDIVELQRKLDLLNLETQILEAEEKRDSLY